MPIPTSRSNGSKPDLELVPGREAPQDDPDCIVAASNRIRREQAAKIKQFESWDKLVETPAFSDFLVDRGIALHKSLVGELPSHVEAECAALGALLMAEPNGEFEVVPYAVQNLKPTMFSRVRHRTIFKAVLALHNKRQGIHKNLVIDLVTVGGFLKRHGQLEEIGTAEYLTWLHYQCPCSANIAAYAEQIIETYKLRTLWAMGMEVSRLSLAPDAAPAILLTATQQVANQLATTGYCDVQAVFEHNTNEVFSTCPKPQ